MIAIAVVAGAAILLLPLFILMFFAVPMGMYQTVPLAPPSAVAIYQDAAESVGEETDLKIDWKPMLVIDAVRLEQEFGGASRSRAEDLAWEFVRVEEVREVDPQTGEIHIRKDYHLRSVDEVLNRLGFTSEQCEWALTMMKSNLDRLADVGNGSLPDGWRPHPAPGWTWPVPGNYRVTSAYGPRVDPVEGIDGQHDGLDVAASHGSPVVAARDGRVVAVGQRGGYGLCIDIAHGVEMTRYAHLSSVHVSRGEEVGAGRVIGSIGSTGKSTGPHLHFEIRQGGRAVDPLVFFGRG